MDTTQVNNHRCSSSLLLLLLHHAPSSSSAPVLMLQSFNTTDDIYLGSYSFLDYFNLWLVPGDQVNAGPAASVDSNNNTVWLLPHYPANLPRERSAGRIIYQHPLQFQELWQSSPKYLSFRTTISFQIFTTSNSSGEGMAFFIAVDPSFPINSSSGYLGLTNSAGTDGETVRSFFAVEFDLRQQPQFHDPSDNHVGINVNSMRSIATVDTSNSSDLSFHRNHSFQARIHFNASTNVVQVWLINAAANDHKMEDLSQSPSIPPILMAYVNASDLYAHAANTDNDLSDLYAYRYVGITATSGKGDVDPSGFAIYSWTFALFSDDLMTANTAVHVLNLKDILAVGIPVTLIFLVLVIALLALLYRARLRNREKNRMIQRLAASQAAGSVRCFSYSSLKKATGNFSDKALLGEGGYSKVYKGTLRIRHGASVVSIKRLKGFAMEERDKASFVSEVQIISSIRHRNLLQLKGWCYEKRGKALLVYEHAENGSLEKLLYKMSTDEKAKILPSERRVRILVGAATALEYLHDGLGECVLHRDVKAASVLLNEDWEALLGDFGLARLVSHDRMGATMTAAGTPGYLAPEVVYMGLATEKADVYSFGVLALEMACGRRVLDANLPVEEMNLVEWVRWLVQNDRVMDAIDSGMGQVFDEEVRKKEMGKWRSIIHLALMCCHPQPEGRPSMLQARQVLVDGSELGLPEFVAMGCHNCLMRARAGARRSDDDGYEAEERRK